MTASIAGVRNSSINDLVAALTDQSAHKVDVVLKATDLRMKDGRLTVTNQEPIVSNTGVTAVNGWYELSDGAVSDLAEKLGIPVRYLRKLIIDRPWLADSNVNGLIHGKVTHRSDGTRETVSEPSAAEYLLRAFSVDGQDGLVRAVLSDRYGIVDHLDVVTAVLGGIREGGAEVTFRSCNLSDTAMSVRLFSPSIAALAPEFLKGYRNPFANPDLEQARQEVNKWRTVAGAEGQGFEAGQEPIVYAGMAFGNSETGDGKFWMEPEIVINVCRNGLRLPLFRKSRVHLGTKMDTGSIDWSADTRRKYVELLMAQARDAVSTWLSDDFLAQRVNAIESSAGAVVTEPTKAIERLSKELSFTDTEREGILAHFIQGGQLTSAGVANAITSYSQTLADFERQDALDAMAITAMGIVAQAAVGGRYR